MALVRVINAADAVPSAAVRLDGVTLFDSVPAGTVTDFREVPRTRRHFTAYRAGMADTVTLATLDRNLMSGHRYSVVLVSEDMATRTLRILEDELVPDSGMARLRIIHAASGGPPVDIRAVDGTETLFGGVTFGGSADFKDVFPATLALEVRAQGTPRVLLTTPPMTLVPRAATTVVIHGATALHAFVFTDAPTPAVSGG
jgi:hypothetical protein